MNWKRKSIGALALGVVMSLAAPSGYGQAGADFDGDCRVDISDLLVLLASWGPCGTPEHCPRDIDGDGAVDLNDLLALLAAWGNPPCQTELAGLSLSRYPYFEYVRAFNSGDDVWIAIDPSRFPSVQGETCDVYVVASRTQAEWDLDASLVDVTGAGPLTHTFAGPGIAGNTLLIPAASLLSADAGASVGVGYDIIVDVDRDGLLSDGDFIDGRGDEAGFYMVHDVTQSGPYAVSTITYNVAGISGSFNAQRTYYPTNIDDLGVVPVVIVSHGNGHSYTWYNHIGSHLASYGYVVMSHQNNTSPGVFSASTTTLQHTNALFTQQAAISGGVLNGHLDANNIVWIGHSRGGEGVVIAYDRVVSGTYAPQGGWSADSIRLISSIAPTDFLTLPQTNPHGVPFHLWTGGSDADVNGCADCNLCQTFHLHDRALQYRQSTSLYGVGHGDFHNGGGSSVATGPCLVGRAATHTIMRGYLLPLVEHYVRGNVPAKDFLWRPWSRFRPIGAPTSECVVVNLMYRDGDASGKFVIDDHQTEFDAAVASSGSAVTFDVTDLVDGRLDDGNSVFTWTAGDLMNGMTVGGAGDFTRGVSFEWTQPSFYEYELVPQARDLRDFTYLSFRAAQTTRHPNTNFDQTPLTFTVLLIDGAGEESRINFSAYGAGLSHPYARMACGVAGPGWHSEFETIRIRLTDFLHDGSGVDLSDLRRIRFEFGAPGSAQRGRIGLDDVEVTTP